jgi:ankyrin repeat protein
MFSPPAILRLAVLLGAFAWGLPAAAQTPPGDFDLAGYTGLFSAVVQRDADELERALQTESRIDRRDRHGRSALHVAAFYANHQAMRRLVAAGADANALENDFYDIVTIAAVAGDIDTLNLALELGCKPDNVTSRYDGTALIAAAHLGHVEIVEALIRAGAPLDHVNNLNWTALIESIVLGDGGARHTSTLRALVEAGADVNLADGRGTTPLGLARIYGYRDMIRILLDAGAK